MKPKIETINLCKNCIAAIKSRGEKVFVGDEVYEDPDEPYVCDWCEEDEKTLYECHF